MYRFYIFICLFVFLGCSVLNPGNREPAWDAGVIDDRTGEVILFYEDGGEVVIKACTDNTALRKRSDCEAKSEVRRIPVGDFKESLKMVLNLSGANYESGMKAKIDLYNDRSTRSDDGDREKLLESQSDLKSEIAELEAFISEFRSGSDTPIGRRVSRLKENLSAVEGELGDYADLNKVIDEINKEIDDLVDKVISEDKLERYVYSDASSGFIYNILKSYLTAHMFSATFKRISVDKINDFEGGKVFMMGSPREEDRRQGDEDQVAVSISKDYEIMTKEVTQKEWFEVTGKNPSRFKKPEHCDNYMRIGDVEMCPENPVESVTWNEVDQLFIKNLNAAKGLTGCDGTPRSQRGCYRLPTEAEWEWAARGGTTTAYSFGNNPAVLPSYGIYSSNSGGKTHPVGSLRANPYDLYDVHGNVWEWVQDRYKGELLGGTDPLQTSGLYRVVRGGGWFNYALYLRSAFRNYVFPGFRLSNVGFRLVRTL